MDFKKAYALLSALPHCSGSVTDAFWDKVPQKDIDEIILNLAQIIRQFKSASNASSPEDRAKMFVMALTAYDIAAQLAQGCPDVNLGDRYAFSLDDVYSEQQFFTDPTIYHTVKRVAQNFERRCHGKERILSNAVNFNGNQYDNTVHYIMRTVLNEEQRKAVGQSLMKKTNADSGKFSDEELFGHLMENIDLKDNENYVLDRKVKAMIGLSASAHGLGMPLETYQKNKETGLWFYHDCRFHHEVARQNKLKENDSHKHLPMIEEASQAAAHQDFSENTIYYPRDARERERKKYRSHHAISPEARLQPYQIYTSGRLQPDSTPWNTDKDNQLFHEMVDEDFRHIECSPNLEVSRLFAWGRTHVDKLNDVDIRTCMQGLLFQYGKLDKAYATQFEYTVYNMNQFLTATIAYCRNDAPQDTALLLWAANLACDLRHHLEVSARLYNLPLAQQRMPQFREILLEKMLDEQNANIKSEIASTVVRDFRNTTPLSLKDCCTLIAARIIANLGSDGNASDDLWDSIKPELLNILIENQKEITQYLNPILLQFLKLESATEWKVAGTELVAKDKDFRIDLSSGNLEKEGMHDIKECTEKTIANNKKLFQRLQLTAENIIIFDSPKTARNQFKSSDGLWEFSYEESYKTIKNTFHLMTVENTQEKFKMLNIYDLRKIFQGHKNPFESRDFYDSHYQYWQSVNQPDFLFIRQENSPYAYMLSLQSGFIYQLQKDENKEWTRNNRILLNLKKGGEALKAESSLEVTDLEKAWAKRLAPLFGLENLRCTATLSEDKKTCQVQHIEHFALGLDFTLNEKQQLLCDEFPGYFLSEQMGVEALNGLPSLIILENKKGEKKYILPAFSLNEGEKNNAFNQNDIINCGSLCNKSNPYYTLTFNKNHELVGESDEANLYLAILYRSQGDFKRAFDCLSRCKSANNISASFVNIASQVLTRKIRSPLGAAFDLKLECYLREHQAKWSCDHQKNFETIEFSKDWHKWIKEQIQFYKSTFSNYKSGIAILPDYARLTTDELHLLGEQPIDTKDEKIAVLERSVKPNKRLIKASTLPQSILDTSSDNSGNKRWRQHIQDLKKKYKLSEDVPYLLSTWRTYSGHEYPAYHYVITNFIGLFYQAISNESGTVDKLNRDLFSLLQNDADVKEELYELIALLMFCRKNPRLFEKFKEAEEAEKIWSSEDQFELMQKIGDVFNEHAKEFSDKQYFLIDYASITDSVMAINPLPTDFEKPLVVFELASITQEQACKHPLKAVLDAFVTQKEIPVAREDFALDISGLPKATLIEKRLFDQYKKGHQENQRKMKALYSVKEDVDLQDIKTTLEDLKKADNALILKLENALLRRANQLPTDDPLGSERAKAYNILLARSSEQLRAISISDLFASFLQQDPRLLTKHNPFLTQEDIKQLYAELSDYALLHSRVDQVNQALEIISDRQSLQAIEPYELQLLCGLLDKPRAYDIAEFPEFLVYEYATHRLLREDQVMLLKKIIELIEGELKDKDEMHHCLLQFAAGGGKSSVLIPILAERFARKGFLPVIFNTNELYQIGLEDIPKNLRASFQQNMEVIERELDHQWTDEELEKLLIDLKRWQKEGKCILLKPVTWHSINLAWKLTGIRAFGGCVSAKKVLDFLKQYGVKLEDECHVVSDPLQQSIKTFGRMQSIPSNQLELLLKCYSYMMGHEKESTEIARLAGIQSNRKRPITSDELSELQEKLASIVANEPAFKDIPRDDLIAYFLQEDQKRPQWLQDLYKKKVEDPNWKEMEKSLSEAAKQRRPDWKMIFDKNARETADFIVFARAFLHTQLPHLLSLQHQKDYGTSIHPGDLTAAPKHEGKDVTSHFGDHTKVAALTIQMTHQRGLLPEQVLQLLGSLMQAHITEREWNTNTDLPTQAEQWLLKVIPDNIVFGSYQDLTQTLKIKLSSNPAFFKHPAVINKFLQEFALPQIKVPDQRQTSTAAELQAGFSRSIMFSATPGLPEIYPAFLAPENCFMEEAFEAQVIDTLLQVQNSGLCTLQETQTPSEFFEQFPPDLLAKMTTLID